MQADLAVVVGVDAAPPAGMACLGHAHMIVAAGQQEEHSLVHSSTVVVDSGILLSLVLSLLDAVVLAAQ